MSTGLFLNGPLPTDLRHKGIDCSGLVLWSYNTAAGFSATDTPDSPPNDNSPLPRTLTRTATDQYLASDTLNSVADLRPGDLLFFKYIKSDRPVTHVGMYVGATAKNQEGAVVEAYTERWGVIESACEALAKTPKCTRAEKDPKSGDDLDCSQANVLPCFVGYGRPRLAAQVGIKIGTQSPVTLAVTDPDGYVITANTLFVTDREVAPEVPGELYYNVNTKGDDEVLGRILKVGNYIIKVLPKPTAAPSDTYSLTITTAGNTITLAQNVPIGQIPPHGYGVESNGSTIVPFIPVAIKIKPGSSSPSPINIKSRGTIPVATLSTTSFDALANVDRTSLTFGRSGEEKSLAFCDAGKGNAKGPAGEEDVNGDGLPDLVCHFYTQKTGFEASDTQANLEGRTVSGQLIRGADSVRIVP